MLEKKYVFIKLVFYLYFNIYMNRINSLFIFLLFQVSKLSKSKEIQCEYSDIRIVLFLTKRKTLQGNKTNSVLELLRTVKEEEKGHDPSSKKLCIK